MSEQARQDDSKKEGRLPAGRAVRPPAAADAEGAEQVDVPRDESRVSEQARQDDSEDRTDDDVVDEQSEESFPASDPPSNR